MYFFFSTSVKNKTISCSVAWPCMMRPNKVETCHIALVALNSWRWRAVRENAINYKLFLYCSFEIIPVSFDGGRCMYSIVKYLVLLKLLAWDSCLNKKISTLVTWDCHNGYLLFQYHYIKNLPSSHNRQPNHEPAVFCTQYGKP